MVKMNKWLLKEVCSYYKSQKWDIEPTFLECLALFAYDCEDYYVSLAEYNETLISEAFYMHGSVNPDYLSSTTGVVFGYDFTFKQFCKKVELQMKACTLEENLGYIPQDILTKIKESPAIYEELDTDAQNELWFFWSRYQNYLKKVAK